MNAPTPAGALALPSIPLADIAPSPTNPRKHFDQAALAELASTIKDHGVIQPITVRPYPADRVPAPAPTEAWPFKDPSERKRPTYEIVVGERRWRASRMAGLEEIPAFWRELTDQQVLEIQIIENLQRNDVHPLEEAEGYRLLMEEHGYTVEQIAAKIGKELEKKSYIYGRLKLLDLCQDARNIMYERKLDASTALLVARIPTPGLQKQALKQIAPEGSEPLSYRAAKNHIRHNFTISLKQATFSLTDASLVEAVGSCQDCPKRSGNAPELFGDTDDADVCSDTPCFHDKKKARHQQLLDNAEFNNIPIIRGDEAEAVADSARLGGHSEYVSLDARVGGDEEGRTYREILGDDAPVTAVIENGETDLIQTASATVLADALQAAGWQPKASTTTRITPEQLAKAEEERKQQERKRIIGTTWRKRLIQQSINAIFDAEIDEGLFDELLKLLALRHFQVNVDEFGTVNQDQMMRFGHTFPDSWDEEKEVAKFSSDIKLSWDSAKCFAYLFDDLIDVAREYLLHTTTDEETGIPGEQMPDTAISLAHLLGIKWESIRDEVSAEFDGKAQSTGKTKAKKPKKGTESTPQGLAETAHTPKLAAPAAGTGGEEDGLEARPNVRYALWGSAGWVTWSGKGKKPAWVEQWLANGKKLEDLESKANPAPAAQANEKPASASTGDDSDDQRQDPAQAAPGNESPAATGADSTNGDLFGQAAGDWPQPNEHGVYAADQAERIAIDTKKAKVEGYVLQIGPNAWAWVVDTQRKGENYEGHSSPITAHQVARTRSDAISDIGAYTSQRVCSWIDNDGLNADFKRIKNWADDLLVNGEKAPCLDQKPAAKKEAKALKPVDAWPFPTGSRP